MSQTIRHVVIDETAQPHHLGLLCTRCGARLAINLPVSVDDMVAATTSFVDRHAECQSMESAK